MDPELARLHREGACPFFAAAQKAKSLGVDDVFNDTSQIPLEEAVDIFRSLSMDETVSGKLLFLLLKIGSLILFPHSSSG